ncbi:MAG: DNA polymerase domain-containing protein [Candidatus Bathyarchaeota archaeon]
MKAVGWVGDIQISDAYATLWVKLSDGKVLCLKDSYRPDFYVEVEGGNDPEDFVQTISLHPEVDRAIVEEKYTSILNRTKSKVVHIHVCDTSSLRTVIKDIGKLNVVRSWFNIDLYDFQRYLFSKTFAPTNKVEVKWSGQDKLIDIVVIDDSCDVSPPPFSSLFFESTITNQKRTPNVRRDPLRKIVLQYGENMETLEGAEENILTSFAARVGELDPDFLVAPNWEEELRYILERAEILEINLQLGRELIKENNPENVVSAVRGRSLIYMNDFLECGVAGISELSRFTLAPPTFAAKWPAGKTIDARQSYEALKKEILVPKKRGFPRFAMTAREIHEKDKGGLLFSPIIGLHDNVAELDFESMFPNIIIHHNISYETVTPNNVDKTRKGFLGEVVKIVLDRRLNFKHLRKEFPKNSEEYRWCEQRQKALKRILVCIYGFSGCFANRFNNVAAYNEINASSRRILVQTVNLCLTRGFEVLYGNTDSIFVKRPDSTREDYEELAKTIQRETGLPITVDNHYKFIVFMRQETHVNVEAMNRFFGKLTDGELNCRGIELRRRDYPIFLKEFQKKLIQILLDAECKQEVIESQVDKAKAFVDDTYNRVRRGEIDLAKLAMSKRLHRHVDSYKSMVPHVAAAKHLVLHGKRIEEYDTVDFVFENSKHRNPLRRVLPTEMIDNGNKYYDRTKYGKLVLDVANTVLKTLKKTLSPPMTLDYFSAS